MSQPVALPALAWLDLVAAGEYANFSVGHLRRFIGQGLLTAYRPGARKILIDRHGEESTKPKINIAAAIGWYAKLASLGFSPLLTDSNGASGYPLLAVFGEPVATQRVFAFV